MKPIRTDAIVLRRTNYGEADRIVQILTPEYGKRSIIAKGVRREKSRLAGGIELFSISDVTLHPGKGSLDTLTSVRLNTYFAQIIKDYDKLQLGYAVLKDVGKVSEILHEPALYEVLKLTLQSLDDPQIDVRVVEIWYRLQMAIVLGVGINLATDVTGEKLKLDATYHFEINEMSFVEHPKGRYTADHIKVLRVASSQAPIVIANIQNVSPLLDDCLHIARIAHE